MISSSTISNSLTPVGFKSTSDPALTPSVSTVAQNLAKLQVAAPSIFKQLADAVAAQQQNPPTPVTSTNSPVLGRPVPVGRTLPKPVTSTIGPEAILTSVQGDPVSSTLGTDPTLGRPVTSPHTPITHVDGRGSPKRAHHGKPVSSSTRLFDSVAAKTINSSVGFPAVTSTGELNPSTTTTLANAIGIVSSTAQVPVTSTTRTFGVDVKA